MQKITIKFVHSPGTCFGLAGPRTPAKPLRVRRLQSPQTRSLHLANASGVSRLPEKITILWMHALPHYDTGNSVGFAAVHALANGESRSV